MMIIFAIGSFVCGGLLFHVVNDLDVYKQQYRDTTSCSKIMENDANSIEQYYVLSAQSTGATLSSSDVKNLETLRAKLYPPAGTNTVWILFSSNNSPLLSNLDSADAPTIDQISALTDKHYEQIPVNDQYVVIGLRSTLVVSDIYSRGQDTFRMAKQWFALLIIAVAFCTLLSIILFSFLIAAAGHKPGMDGIALNPADHIWLEIDIVCLLVFASTGLWSVFGSDLSTLERYVSILFSLFGILIPTLSIVRRAKAGVLFQTSFLYLIIRFIKSVFHHFNLMARVIGIMALYGLFQVVLIFGIISGNFLFALIWLFSNIAIMILICIVIIQYDRIRKATDKMAQGELGQVVDENSLSFFRQMARNLNSTGQAMSVAVERAMRSEHMKTELITNVSHDIKTPLTSIISYVDLLKTCDINDPKALEYIDILERKSKRLGQLMMDLVEASKVNSGNISVEMENINLGELVKQASGEFESRMEERGIQLVCTLPEVPVYAYADGRHMWRVLDNLFSNAAKYALDNTRIYVDLLDIGRDAVLSIKNISGDPLNIEPNELMERFVRGDTSRHTEGSGLGLSIAKSLMELQHGTMKILIDGDLFKVVLVLKRVYPES